MEEDINYLKYGIKELEGSYELHNREWAKSILQEMKNSLEHLIKAYKEQQEENETLKNIVSEIFNSEDVTDNFIPVSLVEETIEELDKEEKELQDSITEEEREEYSDANISFELMDIEIRRSILQELLEKR